MACKHECTHDLNHDHRDLDSAAAMAAGHTDAVRALAVANDRLFSGSYDGTVKVWDGKTMECLQTLAGHTGPVRTLVYSGGHMFSGSYDKTVRLMQPASALDACCWGSKDLLAGLTKQYLLCWLARPSHCSR